jgi:Sec-independent protein translocase protein TatA
MARWHWRTCHATHTPQPASHPATFQLLVLLSVSINGPPAVFRIILQWVQEKFHPPAMAKFLSQAYFYGTMEEMLYELTVRREHFSWKESAMSFHLPELIVLVGIALAIFGPKTLNSMARNAGKGVSQVKNVKDKIMAELPMEEIAKVTDSIPQVPLNPQQAVRMLLTSEQKETIKKDRETKASEKIVETKIAEKSVEIKVDA